MLFKKIMSIQINSRCFKNHLLKLKDFQEFFKRHDALLMYLHLVIVLKMLVLNPISPFLPELHLNIVPKVLVLNPINPFLSRHLILLNLHIIPNMLVLNCANFFLKTLLFCSLRLSWKLMKNLGLLCPQQQLQRYVPYIQYERLSFSIYREIRNQRSNLIQFRLRWLVGFLRLSWRPMKNLSLLCL